MDCQFKVKYICHWTCTKLMNLHDNNISECLNLHQQSTLSPVVQITPVTMQTVNRQYHSYWYFSVGRSTDIPPLEAGDYIQCPHFHALASQWQCSLHSWAIDRKILLYTWIKMPRTTQNYIYIMIKMLRLWKDNWMTQRNILRGEHLRSISGYIEH